MPLNRSQIIETRVSLPSTYSASQLSDSLSPLINSTLATRLDSASWTLNSLSLPINLKIKIHNNIPKNLDVTPLMRVECYIVKLEPFVACKVTKSATLWSYRLFRTQIHVLVEWL